jgi:cytochrome c oxidase assembly protein subunit 11
MNANRRVALICAAVFFGMVGLSFAAVPLYKMYCEATGYSGKLRASSGPAGGVSARMVTVHFDANVHHLDWKFEPVQSSQDVHLGETKLAFFTATNTGKTAVTGRALYNVSPRYAAPYFSKLECFCFKNQTIAPGQTVQFPVVYYVDKRLADDPDASRATELTLSYTFLPAVIK